MLEINADGLIINNPRIVSRRTTLIERAFMPKISGIVVHQTGSPTEEAVFNSYKAPGANGAHFLIGKQGAIYQTASVYRSTNHVGSLRARCLAEHRCSPAELVQLRKGSPKAIHRIEMTKSVPARYPANVDSIGIEIVGMAALPAHKKMPLNLTPNQQQRYFNDNAIYETVNGPQQTALQYLVDDLRNTMKILATEVHRHPAVSYKNATEAGSARW